MFAQKFGFWNEYGANHAASYDQYPYANQPNPNQPNFTYSATNNNNNATTTTISPNGSTCSSSRSYENTPDYLKEILDKIADKEKYILGIEKQLVGNINPRSMNDEKEYTSCVYNASIQDTHDDDSSSVPYSDKQSELKKASILSRFYKADGTPIKSLWDSDANLKEQRAYKYDPKPLERRKNPRAFVPDDRKTRDYWERRRKNNLAARKSREDRRRKEIEILKVCDNLKNDNLKLKIYAQKVMAENQNLKYELDVLKRL